MVNCNNTDYSKTIRKDLLQNIEKFIDFSEESVSDRKNNKTDTNIYWVEFSHKDGKDIVAIMQQPYYHSKENDGFIIIGDNHVFFHSSKAEFVDIYKLKENPPSDIPNENSKMAGLGFNAPYWCYEINDYNLKKIELKE